MAAEDVINQWLADVQAADAEALKSQVAFTTGRFERYWDEQGKAAQARLDAIYGPSNADASGPGPDSGDREPRVDSGGGAVRGG